MNPAIQLIEDYRREIIDKDIDRHRAAEIRAKLSALYGNVTEEMRKTEMAYNQKFAEVLAQNDSVAKSEVLSKITPEYTNYKTIRDVEKVLIEMIRSLKHIIDVKDNEWFEGTH